jgi:hypothetical protein
MRERIAGPRGTGKPLQIAVDSVPGLKDATQGQRGDKTFVAPKRFISPSSCRRALSAVTTPVVASCAVGLTVCLFREYSKLLICHFFQGVTGPVSMVSGRICVSGGLGLFGH